MHEHAPQYTGDAPVFQSVGHALHVSYLIHSMAATTRSPTAIVIDRLVKENHVWDELPAPASSRVNFSGLSPLEVRAQCAQVISMVNNLPHAAERAACRAMYGHQIVKAEGVQGIAAYLEPALDRSPEFCKYVAWHVFMEPKQRKGVTLGDIGQQFGVSTKSVEHAAATVRRYGISLHKRALEALKSKVEDGGLIPSEAGAEYF